MREFKLSYTKEQNAQYCRELRNYCKKHHICCNCYSKDVFTENGRALCADCAEKQAEYKRTHTDKQHRNELRRILRQKHIENHECAECGKPLGKDYTYKLCTHCRTIRRQSWRKMHPDAFTRGEYGICWLCNKKPALEGKRTCEQCYTKLRDMCIERNKQMDNSKHIFRRLANAEIKEHRKTYKKQRAS